MADVRPLRPGGGPGAGRSRGQLLAITGLVIAITLVLLAVLLNSVIYAENLSTRGSDIGGSDAAAFERAVESSTEEVLLEINNDTGLEYEHEPLVDQLEANVSDWQNQSHAHVIRDGIYTDVSVSDTTNGTLIEQTDGSTLTRNDGGDDLPIGNGVRVRDFVLEINGSSSDDLIDISEFTVHVSSSDGDWEINVIVMTVDGENVIGVEAQGDECPGGENGARIDFVNETVNGEPCDAAVFADGLEPPYDINYEDGDKVKGNYSLVIDTEVDPDAGQFADPSDDPDGSPHVYPAIYSADVGVTYETDQIEYESIVEIVPGENDDD